MDYDEQLRVLEWNLVELSGWTLEYIRNLSLKDIQNHLSIVDAKAKIQSKSRPKTKGKSK